MRINFEYKKIFLSIIILVNCFVIKLTAQQIDSTLNIYADKFQQERVYIQYDKPAYAPGETIWFKAYLMAGIEPSGISKNFFVDWADADGKVLAHTIFPIVEASAKGEFEVPANINTPFVHVKAYTQWMLNFDTAFIYNKDIRLIQKAPAKNAAGKIIASIQFFPEGGDLVAGINSKVAFKGNDQTGKPVKVKGVIQNSKGVFADSFKSTHDGMGFCYLNPLANETYTAKWYDEQGAVHQTALPAAKSSGVILEVSNVGTNRLFSVKRSDNVPENLKQLHIVATMHQQVVYMANIKLTEKNIISTALPTGELPTGVLQITLFDAAWAPQCERIIYINNNEAVFSPEVGFSALGFKKRGRNVVEINMPDTLEANLSIAVTDAGIGADSSNNIISHLLLTGDIKGSVYKPSYYFLNNSDSVAKHLDLVMLTHGWRRINWTEVVQGKLPTVKYPKDTSYLSFSGKVFGANAAQLREAGDLLFILNGKDSSKQTLTLPIASNGTFNEPSVILFDTVKVFYQFIKNRSFADMSEVRFMNGVVPSSQHIYINKSTWFDTAGTYRNSYLAAEKAKLEELLKGTTLQGVTVKAKTKSPAEVLDEKYANGLFSGGDAYQFDITGDVAAQNSQSVFTYLQGRVAGLQISINGSQPSMQWRGSRPAVYLDEVQTDVSAIANISMSNVAYVKVFRPPFTGGFGGGAGGAIAVYTRKGGDVKKEPGKGLPYKLVTGYTAAKEFYSPNYGTFDERNEQQDVRTTLYWNPGIITTSENHKIKLTFYNSDVSNSFRVIVEGVSKEGRLTHIEKVVE